MTLRIVPLEDVELLDALALDAERDGHRMVTRLIEEWRDGSNRFDRSGECFLLAAIDGEPVGVGGLNVDPYAGDPAVGRVRHLYVDTSFRRRSVGSTLLDQIVQNAQTAFRLLRLRTRNPEAAAFYRARGFMEVEGDEFCTHQVSLNGRIGSAT